MLEKHPNQVIVECGGVGYDVTIPVSTYSEVPEVGAEVRLRIHTHVREDAFSLFGFATELEKSLFEKLIGVSGIGPKLAVTVLSGLRAEDLVQAIRSGDLPRLVKVPGIGKKTAERMVLELKDKVDAVAAMSAVASKIPVFSGLEEDVLSALQNLGSARPAAEAALAKARAAGVKEDFESLFRKALDFVR